MPIQVRASHENHAADRCVDVFVREDGSFGFEEYRRDAEDQKGWFSLHRYAGLVFVTEELALQSARASVAWMQNTG